MTASAWTDDRVDRLKTLWLEGKTADEVARELAHGVTRSAVLGKVYRMGLSAGRPVRRKSVSGETAPGPAFTRPAMRTRDRSRKAVQKEVEPETGLTTLGSVGRCECRWPYGEPRASDFTLCGRPITRGAFCAVHAARAYRPASDTAFSLDRLALIH